MNKIFVPSALITKSFGDFVKDRLQDSSLTDDLDAEILKRTKVKTSKTG